MKNINFVNEINKFKNEGLSKLLNKKINKLLKLDNYLAKNREEGLSLKGFRKRTIFSSLGNITIQRRRYKDKKGKYRYLLDEYFNWDKNKYIVSDYKKLAIENYDKFNSYQKIANNVFKGSICKSTIFNLIKNNTKRIKCKEKIDCKKKVLFLNIDEIFIKKNKSKNSNHIRTVLAFTNRKSIKIVKIDIH